MQPKAIKLNTELPRESQGYLMIERRCPYQDVWLNCSHKLNNLGNKFRKQKPACKYKGDVEKCPLYKQWKKRTDKFINL